MWETWVWSLGQEDPLVKEMATHSSILAWKIPWMVKPGRLQSMGSQRVGYDLNNFTIVHGIAELDVTERLSLSLSSSRHTMRKRARKDARWSLSGFHQVPGTGLPSIGGESSKEKGEFPVCRKSGQDCKAKNSAGSQEISSWAFNLEEIPVDSEVGSWVVKSVLISWISLLARS